MRRVTQPRKQAKGVSRAADFLSSGKGKRYIMGDARNEGEWGLRIKKYKGEEGMQNTTMAKQQEKNPYSDSMAKMNVYSEKCPCRPLSSLYCATDDYYLRVSHCRHNHVRGSIVHVTAIRPICNEWIHQPHNRIKSQKPNNGPRRTAFNPPRRVIITRFFVGNVLITL